MRKFEWINCHKQMPPERCGKIFVTNNIRARDAFGHMSHVWLVSMLHRYEEGDKTIHDQDAIAEYGQFTAFNDGDSRLCFITHWAHNPFDDVPLDQQTC